MPTRLLRTALPTIAAMALFAPATASAAFSGVSVSASPGLQPAFNQAINDYTTTCAAGSVKVSAKSPTATKVAIDAHAGATGKQSVSVPLSASQRFQITLGSGSKSASYSIRCVPADFEPFKASGTLPATVPFALITPQALFRSASPYAIAIDRHGVPIWWVKGTSALLNNANPAGPASIGVWSGHLVDGGFGDGVFEALNLDGTVHRTISTPAGIDPHESILLSNGDWLLATGDERHHVDLRPYGGPADGTVWDAKLNEYAPDGSVVWSWNAADHIGLAETGRWWPTLVSTNTTGSPYDTDHLNAIADDGKGGLIVSFRHLDSIFRIRKSDGSIDWKLGGTKTSKSLQILGDSGVSQPLAGQHDARILSDGTVTAYDNGSGIAGRAPRVVRWKIDPVARTAKLVETFRDKDVSNSVLGGSARRQTDGSWLVSWTHWGYVRAYSSSHKRLFNFQFKNYAMTYRAVPVPKGTITRSALVAGMDAMNPR